MGKFAKKVGALVAVAELGTGTADATKFLRGDNTWATPPSGGSPSDSVAAETSFGASSSAGVATTFSRGDHTHGTPATPTKATVGLGSVDNTSDAAKPVSTAQQTALDLKANDSAVVKLTTNQTVGGVKTFTSLPLIPDEAYGPAWQGSLEPPTKNAVFDKMESIGGGSLMLSTVEVNLLTAPDARRSGRFTITGSNLTPGKPVSVHQANGPYTGKGTREDEAEMDSILVTGKVLNATTIQCFWSSRYRVRGNFKFDYVVSG